ncbi:MAG: hypothetical protein EP297_00400 [Gammaproteobacteria bacterium]|nr:MAG: hypothetical protein EP297_00400 [Gammaproteobacteria bacterium]
MRIYSALLRYDAPAWCALSHLHRNAIFREPVSRLLLRFESQEVIFELVTCIHGGILMHSWVELDFVLRSPEYTPELAVHKTGLYGDFAAVSDVQEIRKRLPQQPF